MQSNTTDMNPDEIESTLTFDTDERYPNDDNHELVAEGIHEHENRKVRVAYTLADRMHTVLEVVRYYSLDGVRHNQDMQMWNLSRDETEDEYIVEYNDQELTEFIDANFHVDPVIELTDSFESMVDV